ncbi:hypothetical protein ACP26L_25760 [Paenibacillus sp. S-38]|uniref:hypothetical protein n=1 Tax=Paenibacillus sp. S-38 TaxID=3416710 RepID=UPI003CFA4696
MDKLELSQLLVRIQRRYPNYEVPVDDDDLVEFIEDLHSDLKDTPYDVALSNLRRYVIAGNKYPPAIAVLMQPLEPEPDEIGRYHDALKREAQEHLANLKEWTAKAVPCPDHVREEVRRVLDAARERQRLH